MVKNEIKVFARLKPERRRNKAVNYQIHRRPKSHSEEDFLVLTAPQKSFNEYIDNRPESWNFSFYKIFQEDSNQQEIFENVARPVVDSVLCGYNGTIFAYGQTGSGKTYSITGDQRKYNDRGVLPRTLEYLFDVIRKKPENLYSIEISYLEIYNENGYDLLYQRHEIATRSDDFPKRVTIQEDETGVLHLKNLNFHNVDNESDALDLLALGETNRAISETPMNPQSSRSHCIFTIIVSMKKHSSDHHTKAKMHLVDLAGSERVYKCAITGTILTEAKHINLSLHYLEQVIVCLGQDNITHVPYRNSLLTAILRDSLGGNCLTTMLATLSIATFSFEETISTCRFAQRVALIKNDVNLVFEKDVRSENMFLKMEIERLKLEINRLSKNQIESTELLSEDEMKNLDHQISNFLVNGSNVMWDNDPRKVQYCFEAMRMSIETGTRHKTSSEMSSTALEYYKNLVLQRDKEISLLIELLKKERANNEEKLRGVDNQKVSQQLKFERKYKSKPPKETLHLATNSLENNSTKNSNVSLIAVQRRDTQINATEIDISPPIKLEQNCFKKEMSPVENNKISTFMESKNISSSSQRRISYSNPVIPELDLNKITDNCETGRKGIEDKTEMNEQFSGTYPKLVLQSTRRIAVSDLKESIPQYFSSINELHNHDGIECATTKKTISEKGIENQNIGILEFSKSSNKPRTRISENKRIGSKQSENYLKMGCNTTNRLNQTLPIHSPNTEIPIEKNSPTHTITLKDQTITTPINSAKTIHFLKRQSGQDQKQDNVESKSITQSTNTENKKYSFKTPSLLNNMHCVNLNKIVESNQNSENLTENSILTHKMKPTKSTKSERKTVADLIASSRKSIESKEHLSEDKKVTEVADVRQAVKTDYIDSMEESTRKAFEKSLPLTGDPEIDEEIIAFYKAKRSGGTY
ncbi:kinesin-like protein KIF6 isoform X1 [Cephus cinctus]|uniref:Kinesin-like protein n=1 Tax=Cephus cinctus TaxID=211228 RepID=A0AAJ7W5Y9_CEPCN|nr:kinesin-like protein KIF6 isoform X1 [Cephus cinctus]